MDNIKFKIITNVEECKKLLQLFSECLESLQQKNAVDFFAEKFSEHANVIVAENCKNACMGFIAYYANNIATKTAYITMIATLPEYRGMHIGQSLMDYCKKDVFSKGYCFIGLEVGKNNLIAQQFYEKNGFVVIDKNEKLQMRLKF